LLQIVHKLGVMMPEEHIIQGYMKTIAEVHKVDWQPTVSLHLLDTVRAPCTPPR
jgi:hypothetical protein